MSDALALKSKSIRSTARIERSTWLTISALIRPNARPRANRIPVADERRPHVVFAIASGTELTLRESLLGIIDVSMLRSVRHTVDRVVADVAELAGAVRYVRGSLSLLWHNSSVGGRAERQLSQGVVASLMPR